MFWLLSVSQAERQSVQSVSKARFPFKRNRLRCVRCVNENRKNRSVEAVATMIGCLPTQALAFLAVFVYATHAMQAIAFEWKPGLSVMKQSSITDQCRRRVWRNADSPSISRRMAIVSTAQMAHEQNMTIQRKLVMPCIDIGICTKKCHSTSDSSDDHTHTYRHTHTLAMQIYLWLIHQC